MTFNTKHNYLLQNNIKHINRVFLPHPSWFMRLPLCWFAFVLRFVGWSFWALRPFELVGWLVGCFGFNGPLIQYFSLYRAVSQRKGEREEKGQMRVKMSKQPPPAPTASAVGPCLLLSKTVFQSISSRRADRGRKKRERIDVKKMSKQHTPASTESAISPCPTIIQTSRTPRHWKFIQHLRTTSLLF